MANGMCGIERIDAPLQGFELGFNAAQGVALSCISGGPLGRVEEDSVVEVGCVMEGDQYPQHGHSRLSWFQPQGAGQRSGDGAFLSSAQ